MSFKSTGIKVSKQILSNVRITQAPMFAKNYSIDVMEMRDGNNLWYEKKITPLTYVTKEEFAKNNELFMALKSVDFKIDTTGEEGDNDFDMDGKPGTHTEL